MDPASHIRFLFTSAAFTVHGLWPNKFTGWHPANCNQRDPDYEFEKENVSEAVQNEMNCEWQSYKNNTTNEGFWEWEWEKHGTCALIFFKTWGDFDSPQDAYFTTTMELNNQYDLNDLFIDVPKPNTGLNVWDVRKLFEDTWNVSPWISCQKTTQIFEIYMCFNGTTLEPIDCRGGGNGTVCSSSSMLMLPEGAPVSDTCRVFA